MPVRSWQALINKAAKERREKKKKMPRILGERTVQLWNEMSIWTWSFKRKRGKKCNNETRNGSLWIEKNGGLITTKNA